VHQHVEGQPRAGQGAGLQAVLQQVGALHVRGRGDASVGLQVLQQTDGLVGGRGGLDGEVRVEGVGESWEAVERWRAELWTVLHKH